MTKKKTFKGFIALTSCCDSLLILMRPRAYVECSCGRTSVDAGDGYYYRLNLHEGIDAPKFYQQAKKGSLVMKPTKKR
jgi:hypothetical protein